VFYSKGEQEMKKKIILIIATASTLFAQTVYEVTPGTKGNEITLTVANISETNPTANVNVFLAKKSSSLNFSKEEEMIENLEAKAEAEVKFTFDVSRNAIINKKDTIEFTITSPDGIMMMKQFIFSYTGPTEFKLEQNYPNPFNPTTTIQYQLPQDSKVILKVYDILGSEVAALVNEEQEAGYKEVKFDAINFASGIYVYRLQAGDYISSKKMMLLR
jgi:5-hydroxyisourate hydrolase-like protein (transthyretin family)